MKDEELLELAFRVSAISHRHPPDMHRGAEHGECPPPPEEGACCGVGEHLAHLPPMSERGEGRPPVDGMCRGKPGEMPPPGPHFRGRFRVLSVLSRGDGLTQKRIAEELGIRPPSLCETLCRLEEDGLVERRANENDRREILVYITDRGRESAQRHREMRTEAARKLFEPLDDGEKETLARLLAKIFEAQK